MTRKTKIEIRTLPIGQINRAPYNPRKHLTPDDPEYQRLKRSIERWDLVEPLVWNQRTGVLVGGHQRLSVMEELDYTEVEVSVVDLDEQDEAALNVALNRISGAWDEVKLVEVLSNLDAHGYDATLTGFDPDQLEELLISGTVPDDDGDGGAGGAGKVVTCPACGHEWNTSEA